MTSTSMKKTCPIPVSFWPRSSPVILSSPCLNYPLLYHTWDIFIAPCCIRSTVSMSISLSLTSTSDFSSNFPLVSWLHQYIRLGHPIHWPDCNLLPLIVPFSSILAFRFHGPALIQTPFPKFSSVILSQTGRFSGFGGLPCPTSGL